MLLLALWGLRGIELLPATISCSPSMGVDSAFLAELLLVHSPHMLPRPVMMPSLGEGRGREARTGLRIRLAMQHFPSFLAIVIN